MNIPFTSSPDHAIIMKISIKCQEEKSRYLKSLQRAPEAEKEQEGRY